MRKKISTCSVIIIAVFVLSLSGNTQAQAGTKDMVASKRIKFEDDSTETMREVHIKREAENKEYREKILSNSNRSIELLTEIKNLLEQLNEKE